MWPRMHDTIISEDLANIVRKIRKETSVLLSRNDCYSRDRSTSGNLLLCVVVIVFVILCVNCSSYVVIEYGHDSWQDNRPFIHLFIHSFIHSFIRGILCFYLLITIYIC